MTDVRRLTLTESFEPFAARLSEAQSHALTGSRLVNVVPVGGFFGGAAAARPGLALARR